MDDTQRTSTWRKTYKVHPLADVFPMMSDEELAVARRGHQGERAREPITFDGDRTLLDGRNRLEAMERAGVELTAAAGTKTSIKMIRSLTSSRRTSTAGTSPSNSKPI